MVNIMIPMSTAVIAAWSLFIAVAQWNSWFDALIYIRNEYLMPLQLIMVNLFNANLGWDMNFQTGEMVNRVSLMSLRMAIRCSVRYRFCWYIRFCKSTSSQECTWDRSRDSSGRGPGP